MAEMRPVPSRTARIALTSLGFLFVAIGVIGIFVPVLPTTVWLLLAAGCWMRSSKRFYHWLMHNRLLGSYLRNYREKRGISVRHKVFTLVILWAGIGVSALLLVSRLWLSLLLFAVAVGVTIHILTLRTIRPDDDSVPGASGPDARGTDVTGPSRPETNSSVSTSSGP